MNEKLVSLAIHISSKNQYNENKAMLLISATLKTNLRWRSVMCYDEKLITVREMIKITQHVNLTFSLL